MKGTEVSHGKWAPLSTEEVTGIILAGGRNSRMGHNKAFLEVKQGQTMIEFTVEMFNSLFQETIIVTNQPELYHFLGVEVITDLIPGRGPLSGLHAGLIKAANSYSFVVPCDMPFLEAELIRLLVSLAPGYEVVVPLINDNYEPLHAVYSKSCLVYVERCFAENIRSVYAFYPWAKVNCVGADVLNQYAANSLENIFLNVNTQAELDLAKKLHQATAKEEKQ